MLHQQCAILEIHIVQMTSLRRCPCLPSFPKYVPNPYILGTKPVLPCKNGKLKLIGAKSVLVLRYSCILSAVGCSQVELSYQ